MAQTAAKENELEGEVYFPDPGIVEQANAPEYEEMYQRSLKDPEGFWGDRAGELEWYKKWDKVLDDSQAPFYKWFVGGKTNIVHNALDRHVKTFRKNKLALIWEGEPGDTRTYSYHALHREVGKFANILKSMGVRKGDVVTIYMPRIPEQAIAMLACAKIGAPHSVVYGGFSVEALAERIEDAQSRVLITADGGWLRGKIVRLKDIADEAMARQPTIENCIVVQAHRPGSVHGSRSGLLAARFAEPAHRQPNLRDGTDGRGRSALHPVYLGDHRQAQRRRAHPRRLHGLYLHDPQLCLRYQRRGPLVVRRRPRLDYRAQLHRLLPADQRRDQLRFTKARRTTPTRTAGGA